jgi:hypothetical protein
LVSISGLNMVKKIVGRHVEMMCVCQSHSFELFVSLKDLIRFYNYVIINMLVPRGWFTLLMNDVVVNAFEVR